MQILYLNLHGYKTLRDYKSEVDNIINEYILVASVVPEDKSFCKLIYNLLNPSNKNKHEPIIRHKPLTYTSSKDAYKPPKGAVIGPPPIK